MARHALEHHFPGPGPRPVALLAQHQRAGARIAAPHADRAGWMLRGACRSEDPELFFPIAAAGPALTQVSSAKAVCGRCPVHPNCLSYALITRPDGIWGDHQGRTLGRPTAPCHGSGSGSGPARWLQRLRKEG
jgi:WhiB family transcriptional regulator, redox-sensing transcriptional regulator